MCDLTFSPQIAYYFWLGLAWLGSLLKSRHVLVSRALQSTLLTADGWQMAADGVVGLGLWLGVFFFLLLRG